LVPPSWIDYGGGLRPHPLANHRDPIQAELEALLRTRPV
jgi:hypothetical protein